MTVSRDLTPIDASAEPWAVVPTQAEREAGTLSPESIARAVEGLNREGVIVLKGVVDLEHVRILRDRVLSDIEQYETDGASEKIEQGGVGWWHNWQGGRPPPLREFLFDDICYNEFVIAAVSGAARPHMAPDWGGWMGGGYGLINMAFKGNMLQECHTDGGSAPIDPTATIDDLPGARPTGFSVNFPLIAQTAESGATEYWPGTHRDLGLKHGLADPAGRFATAQMREDYEAKHGPSKRTFSEPGDALIRNAMVWHRGVANHSDTHRPMISVGYSAMSNEDRAVEGPGGGFTAPLDTADFWTKHPLMRYDPVLLDTVDYQLEQRYHGPAWVEERQCHVPGHLNRGNGPFGTMIDPVTTLAGCTYERAHIEETLAGNGGIDPTCNIRVMPKLLPNKEVKRQIERWLADGHVARM